MKKQIFTFYMLLVSVFTVQLSAQSVLPTPTLKYSCDEITNSHELAPTVGDVTAVITDLSSATSYVSDASIVTDEERGNVLFLPNTWTDANNSTTQNTSNRSLRIISSSSLVGTGDFTISFWTKSGTSSNPTLNGFPQLFLFDGATFEFRTVAWWNSSKPSLKYANNSYLNSSLTPANYIYDWAHYVIVKQGTNLQLYINGVFQSAVSNYAVPNSVLTSLRFNSQACERGSYFDDIEIFDQALNFEQITQLNGATYGTKLRATFEDAVNDSLVKGTKWYDSSEFSSEPNIGVNQSQTGLNLSSTCFSATTQKTGWWGNFGELALKTPVLITDNNKYLKFMVYRTNQLYNYRVAINGDQESEIYQGKASQDGVWEHVVVDLSSLKDKKLLKSIVFVYNCDWSGGSAQTSIHAFDNFALSDNTDTPVLVSVAADPAAGGSTAGSTTSGYYSPGESLILIATANAGYTFVNWTLNGEEVSTDVNYSPSVSGSIDLAYVAHFTEDISTNNFLTQSEKTKVSESIYTIAGTKLLSDDLSTLSAGAYIVKIKYSDGSINSKKIIISGK
ncbi:MAG: hypothetical protein PHH37_06885 [Paludibacter sp.]|nr:hypothetical protein [Paludibacter sp.]